MTRFQALVVALVVVVTLIVTGVAGLCGPWWACIAAGCLLAVTAVLLYDPDPSGKGRRPRSGP